MIQFDVFQRNEYNRHTPGLKGGSYDGEEVCNVWSHSDFVFVDADAVDAVDAADAVDAVDVDAVLVVRQQIYLPAI